MTPVRIGLLGLGTVGASTVTVLARNQAEIARRAGRPLIVTQAAVRDLGRVRDCHLGGIRVDADAHALATAADVDIVVELIGGVEPARSLVLAAIGAGKHVVTANKALIARHGNEIFHAAREAGVAVGFEAAVGGGIPIIKTLREGLAANHITGIAGIINGTTNHILSALAAGAPDLEDALIEAQRLGYAEADPTTDLDGTDAAHKLTILASIAFGMPLRFERVYREGITAVDAQDVAFAARLGYRIKHLAIARIAPDGVEMRVHPTLVPERHPLARVDTVTNAVLVEGDAVGETLYIGPGAGGQATASSVIADLVDIARAQTLDAAQRVPYLAFHHEALVDLPVLPIEESVTASYLCVRVLDRPGVLAELTRILGEREISIEAILQQEPAPEERSVPVVLLTRPVRERELRDAVARMTRLNAVVGPITRIRREHFGL
jgi:homoserine dehydrogenase